MNLRELIHDLQVLEGQGFGAFPVEDEAANPVSMVEPFIEDDDRCVVVRVGRVMTAEDIYAGWRP